MKYIRFETYQNKPVIVMEEKTYRFFRRDLKIERKFVQYSHLVSHYYLWRELPNMELVDTGLSYRLDSIYQFEKEGDQ